MIRLDPFVAMAVFCVIALGIAVWFFMRQKRHSFPGIFDRTDTWSQCPYCGHMFVDVLEQKTFRCRVCRSLVETEGGSA
ncbi:MAG: hypothetical protein HQL19_03130 [Candidatus Omnitrophica bacterium]|nr:hypothetical protein [Candidatus Omnitrophota bacterium]